MTICLGDAPERPVAVSTDSEIADLLGQAFDLGPAPAPGADTFSLHANGGDEVLYVSPHRRGPMRLSRGSVVETLVAELTHIRLFESTGIHLHAGAVARDGDAVVVLGASGAGKSTMTAALVTEGFSLINDEQVKVDRRCCRVSGFHRPISISPGGHSVVGRLSGRTAPDQTAHWFLRPDALGGTWTTQGRPIAAYDLKRRPGPISYQLVSHADSFETLCANSLDLVSNLEEGLQALAWFAATVPLGRLSYEEADSGASAVANDLGSHEGWRPLEHRVDAPKHSEEDRPAPGRGHPCDHVYAIVLGDRVVLFDPRSRVVARLDADGSALWEKSRNGRSRARRLLGRELEAIGIKP